MSSNINYQLELNSIINNLKGTKKLLLHSCCGPCSSYVIEYLTPYFDITVLYYNPNIYPESEYIKRKNEQIKLINSIPNKNKLDIMDIDYDSELFDKISIGHELDNEGGQRCSLCFELRLSKTAQLAKENNYDFFGTTLTVSPHKNSKIINEIGSILEKKYLVNYLYSDFKKKEGYKRSIELAKEYDLYRQNYCGCKYSLREIYKGE